MKYAFVLPLVLFLFLWRQGYGQERSFEQTRDYIVGKVRCCAVPFAPSHPSKVSSIEVKKDGTVVLSYEPDKAPHTFNLFDLYKESDTATGIQVYKNTNFIQFHVREDRTKLISFATHEEAKEVYNAFLDLLQLCERANPALADWGFHQTIEVINIRLAKWGGGLKPSINAFPDGSLFVDNGNKQTWRLNLLDLKDPYYKEGVIKQGIEAVTCTYGTVAPASWINFYNGNRQVGFIKLTCAPDAEIQILHQAFLHLQSLCKR